MQPARTPCLPSHLSRILAALAVALVATALAPPVGVGAVQPKPVFEQIGSLERYPADARAALGESFVPHADKAHSLVGGTMVTVPRARLLLQLYPSPNATTTAVVVRDLDDLRLLRTLRLTGNVDRATSGLGGDWTHAVDDEGTRLWLYVPIQAIYEIDLRTFAVMRRPVPDLFITGFILGGLSYDRFTDHLNLLYSGPAALFVANTTALLYRLDVSTPPPASLPPTQVSRLYRVRACTGPIGSTDAGSDTSNWDVLADETFLYVPCHRAGNSVIVVRMARPEGPEDANQPEEVATGPVWGNAVLADHEGGRLIVTTVIERDIWVFDASAMNFVGVAATGPDTTRFDPTGYGLDTETGHVFFQSPTFGLGVVEARTFPLPEARTLPRPAPGRERIWSDAATDRVFVLEGTEHLQFPRAEAYRIYRVAPAPVPAPNTDGTTKARWDATGSGYGSRVLLVKGIGGVAPAPAVGGAAPITVVPSALNNNPALLPCMYTDRDLFAGRVAKAEYDSESTAAQAAAVAVDEATEQDLNQPARCGLLRLLGPDEHRWDYRPAACASNRGMEQAPPPATGEDHGSTVTTFGPSRVVCPLPGGTLEAEAETKLTNLSVEVLRSRTTTRIERTSAGVVSTVESTAQGVSLNLAGLGTVHIGEIRSKAVSTSNGRPERGAMSTHDITIGDVVVGGTRLCEHTGCDPVKLEERLNLLAGDRAVFRTGHGPRSGRDDALVEGSAKGARTAVQKSATRQAADRALMGDSTLEIPAFEVTVFNDNKDWGRARQLYQFAGVASSASHNVVANPTGPGVEDGAGLADDDTAAPDGGDDVFEGRVEEPDSTGGTAPMSETAISAEREEGGTSKLVAALRDVARGLRFLAGPGAVLLLLLSAWALSGSPAGRSRRHRLRAWVRSG